MGQTSVGLQSDWCTKTEVVTACLEKDTGGIHAISTSGSVANASTRSGVVDAVH